MGKRTVITTILIQTFCWAMISLILAKENPLPVNAFVQTTTPQPFMGPIYYGQENVWQVFDHNLPCASVCDDDVPPPPQGTPTNVYVIHYDGSKHDPITPTPEGDPYIPGGFGYDEHGGIDYSLEYEPVLAAASGIVDYANWHNSSNHRAGYGLYIVLDHTDTDYQTFYGHLSVLSVQEGDEITIDLNDPSNRNRILGISGNTGAAFGTGGLCGPVPNDPTCGQHLHFEVRRKNQIYGVVNPYGWIAPAGTLDPWANYNPPPPTPGGATSYDLWQNEPAVDTDQYPGGTPLAEPAVNNARMIIDDGSADFSTIDTCWVYTPGNDSFNNSYRRANANGPNDCRARWTIRPDAFTLPGDYDVFVHIPEDSTASLGAVYTITHNMQTSRAIVVQAAYLDNNTEHNAWAYLGRYDFAMDTAVSEFIELYDAIWSPDGRQLAFTADDTIWLLSPGEPPTQLTQTTITARHPAWLVEE
ncbi:MAG: peptidoglycan DD-metalloendopeptidase family protein [Chloroflexi bacterium]|nr:peptidoglycan DD-metalloendopeptidase family protein [Ardenticatenaceae bacterium]MBL1129600.1 hypothetical protein [Chloroflexota bacterium]NOG35682.1 peptidoglycan DD-metalloendopeptidase family protein [Chloroflexota bacterium]